MVRTLLVVLALGLLVSAASGGCGSPLSVAGTACTSDDGCAAGLSCLALERASDAGCETLVKVCSKPCRMAADCVAVGAKFKCFPKCNGSDGTCGQTQ